MKSVRLSLAPSLKLMTFAASRNSWGGVWDFSGAMYVTAWVWCDIHLDMQARAAPQARITVENAACSGISCTGYAFLEPF